MDFMNLTFVVVCLLDCFCFLFLFLLFVVLMCLFICLFCVSEVAKDADSNHGKLGLRTHLPFPNGDYGRVRGGDEGRKGDHPKGDGTRHHVCWRRREVAGISRPPATH